MRRVQSVPTIARGRSSSNPELDLNLKLVYAKTGSLERKKYSPCSTPLKSALRNSNNYSGSGDGRVGSPSRLQAISYGPYAGASRLGLLNGSGGGGRLGGYAISTGTARGPSRLRRNSAGSAYGGG